MEIAETPAQVPAAYLHNMQSCGVCYIRYRSLIEAVESRNSED